MAQRATIEVFEDPAVQEGGQAIIRVEGLASQPADSGFTVRRFGYDKGVLGPAGWQGPDTRLQPLTVGFADGTLQLTVGPEVVDAIDVGTPVEIELPAAGVRQTLHWPNIAPSVQERGGAGRTRFAFAPRPTVAAEPAAGARADRPGEPEQATVVANVPPPPPPQDDAATVVGPSSHRSADPTAIPDRANPQHDVGDDRTAYPDEPYPQDGFADFGHDEHHDRDDYEDDHTRLAEDESSGGFPWAIVVGVLLFVLIVGGLGAAYYAFHEDLGLPWPFEAGEATDEPPPAAPPTEPPAPVELPSPPVEPPAEEPRPEPPVEDPVGEPPEAEAAPARDPQVRPLDFARILLARDPSPERSVELALEYLERGEADVALLLLEHAEAEGYAPALTAIGRLYDPAHFDPARSPFSTANPERAADYYRRAIEAGDREAREALDDLAERLRAAAEDGDPAARRALDRLGLE